MGKHGKQRGSAAGQQADKAKERNERARLRKDRLRNSLYSSSADDRDFEAQVCTHTVESATQILRALLVGSNRTYIPNRPHHSSKPILFLARCAIAALSGFFEAHLYALPAISRLHVCQTTSLEQCTHVLYIGAQPVALAFGTRFPIVSERRNPHSTVFCTDTADLIVPHVSMILPPSLSTCILCTTRTRFLAYEVRCPMYPVHLAVQASDDMCNQSFLSYSRSSSLGHTTQLPCDRKTAARREKPGPIVCRCNNHAENKCLGFPTIRISRMMVCCCGAAFWSFFGARVQRIHATAVAPPCV